MKLLRAGFFFAFDDDINGTVQFSGDLVVRHLFCFVLKNIPQNQT